MHAPSTLSYTRTPSRKAAYRIRDTFETLDSVCNAPKSGHPKTSMSEKKEMLVAITFGNSPKESTRPGLQQLPVSRTSLRRLTEKLKLKPYRPRFIHVLLEDDPDRRLQFSESIRGHIINAQPDLLDKIIWSDKTCFKLSGLVNRHDCVYWNGKNPHLGIERYRVLSDPCVFRELSLETILWKCFVAWFDDNLEPKLTLTNCTSSKMDQLHIMRGQ